MDWSLSILDKDFCVDLIKLYNTKLLNAIKIITNRERVSTNLYRILLFINRRLVNHEKYVVFANMIPMQANTILTNSIIESINDYSTGKSELFLLSRILVLDPLKNLLCDNSKAMVSVQTYALETLLQVLCFHDFDERLQKSVLIARLYIDILPITISSIQYKNELEMENLLTLLVSFIWVLKGKCGI